MQASRLSIFRKRAVTAVGGVSRGKVLACVVIAIVPGGLVVPACYAAYHALRHALTK